MAVEVMTFSLFDSYDAETDRANVAIGGLFDPDPMGLGEVEEEEIEIEPDWTDFLEAYQDLFFGPEEKKQEFLDFAPAFGLKPRVPLFKPRVVKLIEMDAVSDISERYLISTFFGDGIKRYDPPLNCPICLEDFHFEDDPIVFLEHCGHFICKACLTDSIEDCVSRSREPACPMFQCGVLLDNAEFAKYGSVTSIDSYDRSFIWQQLKGFVCPGDCYEVVTIDVTSCDATPCLDTISCFKCSTTICGKCKAKKHGDDPCPEIREIKLLDFLSEAAEDFGLNWTSCPVCKQAILRDVGCNHMTCVCGKEFCFFCRRRWNTADAFVNHHSECPVTRGNDIFAKGSFPFHLLSTLPSNPAEWETFGMPPPPASA
eukprot:TRINITY_DN2571_c0_g1_i1.p1 TRINITY_DN2571_c0_g1~~TRINITY_DN2571_c0_g1_i1.p1  ORF type:complete len:371 (-),score=75.08 TRINITY_DN2571_c0_g1_i1:145-1257(-)